MSTTTPETNPPDPTPVTAPVPLGPFGPPGPTGRPAETAPSALLAEGPAAARMIGFIGLFLLVLGVVVVLATRLTGTPRLVPEGYGFLAIAVGLALMLYHATVDDELEVRRAYGGFALLWLIFSVGAALVPGPVFDTTAASKTIGYNLLPWGVGAAFVSLLFSVPFLRHETDEFYRNAATTLLLIVGGALSAGSIVAGLIRPDFLAGQGLTLALLGLGFLCAYLGQVDTSDGPGYMVAFAMGAFGAAIAVYAIGRAAFPTILYEGPAALRNPNGSLDLWKTTFRVLGGVAFAAPAIIALTTRSQAWVKIATGALAVAGVGVVVVSLFTKLVTNEPTTFLVPNGLILTLVGLLFAGVSLGACSDNQFVTLTRRELSAYFMSPIGYLVLGGMAIIQWLVYESFLGDLQMAGRREMPLMEPILADYFGLLPAIALLLLVPALTMRLMAEEKRTGSLEMLMTAPVNEWPVVLSKFVATWIFFLLVWLPGGLYLIALRLEVPVPFDYRPLMGYYVCIAAQGLAFIGMGLFFSTLTKNQIVAAVLTFVGMFFFLLCFMFRVNQMTLGLPPVIVSGLGRLSFFHMWREALDGRLPLRDCFLFASLGVLGLFLSVKVLEMRKWS